MGTRAAACKYYFIFFLKMASVEKKFSIKNVATIYFLLEKLKKWK